MCKWNSGKFPVLLEILEIVYVMQYLLSGRTISLNLLGLQLSIKKYGILSNNLHISSKSYETIQDAVIFFSRGRVEKENGE